MFLHNKCEDTLQENSFPKLFSLNGPYDGARKENPAYRNRILYCEGITIYTIKRNLTASETDVVMPENGFHGHNTPACDSISNRKWSRGLQRRSKPSNNRLSSFPSIRTKKPPEGFSKCGYNFRNFGEEFFFRVAGVLVQI